MHVACTREVASVCPPVFSLNFLFFFFILFFFFSQQFDDPELLWTLRGGERGNRTNADYQL